MLMHHETLIRQNQYYRSEMLRTADHERLVRLASGDRQRQNRVFRPLLAWAGHRLVRAGLYLMSQAYGVKLETRAVQFRQVL